MAFVTHSLASALLFVGPCRAAFAAVFSWASPCRTASRRLPSHCALLDFLHRASTNNADPLSALSLSISVAVVHLYVQRFSVTLGVRQCPRRFLFCRSSVVFVCPRLCVSSMYDVDTALLSMAPFGQAGTCWLRICSLLWRRCLISRSCLVVDRSCDLLRCMLTCCWRVSDSVYALWML